MAFEWIYLAALLSLTAGQSVCPKPEDLLPCTCDYEGVNCMNAKNSEDIKKAFKAVFPYKGTRALWVQGTPITEITSDMFGSIKIQQIYFEMNNVSKINLQAFKAASSQLAILSLFGNKLTDFPYSGLKDLKQLMSLNLGRNLLQTIPDGAFESPTLMSLVLGRNQIRHIGVNAFANLPSLRRLELSMNQIVTLGPMSLASKKHAARLEINLTSNKIANVSSTAFQGTVPHALILTQNQLTSLKKDPFERLIIKMENQEGGGYIEVSNNPLSCSGCDYSWITTNKNDLAYSLIGFTCTDGSSIHDLTKTKIGCHSRGK